MLLFNFSTTLCNWWTCWNHFTIVTQGSELSCRILMIFALRPGFVFCFFTFRSNLPHFRFFSALWSHSFPFSLKFRVVIISRQVESNACRHCSIESGSLIVQTVQWCVCGGLWSSTASWNELPHATDPLRVWFLYLFFKVGKDTKFKFPIDCEGWPTNPFSFVLLSITVPDSELRRKIQKSF